MYAKDAKRDRNGDRPMSPLAVTRRQQHNTQQHTYAHNSKSESQNLLCKVL